ncbi:Uncharacterised protein [Mycobacteroides abscessus subsp. massiliense]|nr:Uncharacterised protein [Mycobacteroides abscessus subsp. massiliense]
MISQNVAWAIAWAEESRTGLRGCENARVVEAINATTRTGTMNTSMSSAIQPSVAPNRPRPTHTHNAAMTLNGIIKSNTARRNLII